MNRLIGFEKYIEDKIVERPTWGYAFDITKAHIHVWDGKKFWVIETNEQGKINIRIDEQEIVKD